VQHDCIKYVCILVNKKYINACFEPVANAFTFVLVDPSSIPVKCILILRCTFVYLYMIVGDSCTFVTSFMYKNRQRSCTFVQMYFLFTLYVCTFVPDRWRFLDIPMVGIKYHIYRKIFTLYVC
jgi:hypothetical protein